jgi:replication factor C subunit 1
MSAKAALLSGPPGIGKTTSVRVIAKQLNLHLVEWNASDIRSKSAIDLGVSHLKDNTTI